MRNSFDLGNGVCSNLLPRQRCFCVRKYSERAFTTVFHEHVPSHRLSQERTLESLRALVACCSQWPADWVLHSLLNKRGKSPEQYPGFRSDTSYPEPGVLRLTVSGTNIHARCDEVVSPKGFRPPPEALTPSATCR